MSATATSSELTDARRGLGGGWAYFAIGTVAMCVAFSPFTFLSGSAVDWYVREDSLVEWIGALGLFAGAGFFFLSFRAARRRGAQATGLTRVGIWVLLLMAGGLFFAGGEEISWAQRILGYGEPANFAKVNAQHEMNLHNLNVFQGTTIDGDRLFRLGYIGLFVLLPVLALLSSNLRRRLERVVPIVAPWLAALFLAAWVLAEIARHTLGGPYPDAATFPMTHSVSEVLESSVEVMAGLAGYLSWRRMRGDGLARGSGSGSGELVRAGVPVDGTR